MNLSGQEHHSRVCWSPLRWRLHCSRNFCPSDDPSQENRIQQGQRDGNAAALHTSSMRVELTCLHRARLHCIGHPDGLIDIGGEDAALQQYPKVGQSRLTSGG